jgi:hypothetical protein
MSSRAIEICVKLELQVHKDLDKLFYFYFNKKYNFIKFNLEYKLQLQHGAIPNRPIVAYKPIVALPVPF